MKTEEIGSLSAILWCIIITILPIVIGLHVAGFLGLRNLILEWKHLNKKRNVLFEIRKYLTKGLWSYLNS